MKVVCQTHLQIVAASFVVLAQLQKMGRRVPSATFTIIQISDYYRISDTTLTKWGSKENL